MQRPTPHAGTRASPGEVEAPPETGCRTRSSWRPHAKQTSRAGGIQDSVRACRRLHLQGYRPRRKARRRRRGGVRRPGKGYVCGRRIFPRSTTDMVIAREEIFRAGVGYPSRYRDEERRSKSRTTLPTALAAYIWSTLISSTPAVLAADPRWQSHDQRRAGDMNTPFGGLSDPATAASGRSTACGFPRGSRRVVAEVALRLPTRPRGSATSRPRPPASPPGCRNPVRKTGWRLPGKGTAAQALSDCAACIEVCSQSQ